MTQDIGIDMHLKQNMFCEGEHSAQLSIADTVTWQQLLIAASVGLSSSPKMFEDQCL